MITVTLKQLLESESALSTFTKKPWPARSIKISYALGKLYRKVADEFKDYNEARDFLIKSNGEESEGKVKLKRDKASVECFTESIKQLHAVEVELYGEKITLAQIEDAELPMTPEELGLLDWLIIE